MNNSYLSFLFHLQAIENLKEFKKRVFAVGFTDSVHDMPAIGCDHLIQVRII